MTNVTQLLIGALIFAICLLIYIPIGSRYIFRFYQLHDEQSFTKRYGYLSIITSCTCLAEILILSFLILDHANIIIFTFNFIWVYSYIARNWSLLLRCWLIYYQFNWHECIATFDDGFQRLLTNNYFNNNWFIAHKHTYGTYEWCKQRLTIIAFIFATMETVLILIYAYVFRTKNEKRFSKFLKNNIFIFS